MPVQSCSSGGKPGYKFGESGKCYTYTPGDSASRASAKSKASAQERAAYAGGWKESMKKRELPPLSSAEQMFADVLLAIADKYGKLEDRDDKGIWVGYISPEDNEDKNIGVNCYNCYFYESEKVCKIIKQEIHPDGMCRLAAIPEGLVNTTVEED